MKKKKIGFISRVYPRFAVFVAGMSLGACAIVIILGYLAIAADIVSMSGDKNAFFYIITLLFASSLIAITATCIFGRRLFRSILEVTSAMQKVAEGDFSVRVSENSGETEFTRISKSFNLMAEELEKNEMLKSDFISNVSHEFKTPLAAIQNCASLLDDDSLSAEERSEYGAMMRDSADYLLNMCTNILRLSKIESSSILSDKSQFSLDEQIRLSILMLEKSWSAKNITLDIELEKVTITANREMLSQIWINIIGNAIKFTPENGHIYITLKNNDGMAIASFRDDGIGMNEETLQRIFDKFYQGDTSHKSNGNGLGLAIASKIARLHSGFIEAESTPNVGSVFTVYLPIR